MLRVSNVNQTGLAAAILILQQKAADESFGVSAITRFSRLLPEGGTPNLPK